MSPRQTLDGLFVVRTALSCVKQRLALRTCSGDFVVSEVGQYIHCALNTAPVLTNMPVPDGKNDAETAIVYFPAGIPKRHEVEAWGKCS